MDTEMLTTAQAARLAGVTPEYIRQLAHRGTLQRVQWTPYGRLYERGEIEELRDRRAAAVGPGVS